MTKLNPAQKAILAKLPKKVHNPNGVTVPMIMKETGWKHAHSGRYMREQIEAGLSEACWYKDGGRWYKAMVGK